MKYELDFFTQYGQFYILNHGSEGKSDSREFWSDDSLNERLAIEDGIIGVPIANDITMVKGELEFLEEANTILDSDANHIVEGSLMISSGILEIQDCPTSTVISSFAVENGNYKVRVYSYNLNEPYIDEEPNDYYKIEIWKGDSSKREVLKQWIPNYN